MALEVIPLNNEELALSVQKGDSEALSRLWEQVKDYAYTVVMRYIQKPYADTEDYLQTAFLGVRAAALAFDPCRGSFLTIADWYIRSACSRFYGWHRRGEVQTISYDVPMNEDDPDSGSYLDSFPDDTLPDPWEGMERGDIVRDVRAAIDELTPRQQEVVEEHYFAGDSLEAIGEAQGVSAQRIRQIEREALKRMRKSEHLTAYRREYAPVKGVGIRAFEEYGTSAVEHVALKNVERARRAELRAFEKHVQESVEQGHYSKEIGRLIVESYRKQNGLPVGGNFRLVGAR